MVSFQVAKLVTQVLSLVMVFTVLQVTTLLLVKAVLVVSSTAVRHPVVLLQLPAVGGQRRRRDLLVPVVGLHEQPEGVSAHGMGDEADTVQAVVQLDREGLGWPPGQWVLGSERRDEGGQAGHDGDAD